MITRTVTFALMSALTFNGCAHPTSPQQPTDQTPTTENDMDIVKSPLDDREYAYFELPNGLKAMVVSDPTVDMAAASLGVHVGQFSDPEDRHGLAHFLEHMLFMGTEKYPDVDDYRNYIQSHGGGSNAGTGQENTTYYFTIDHAYLEGGLDRFSQFFVSPILNPEYVERERNAVNSEYSLKIKTEARRYREVMRKTTNPAHPFSKFSVGNLETLADRENSAVHADMRAFYEREYSASRMTMTVLGRQSTAELRAMVETMFSAIPSDGEDVTPTTVPPYLPEQLGAQINITPLSEKRSIEMQFPVPPALQHFPNKPTAYITSLLGHEGEGSLFSLLKEKGWAESLSAGSDGADDYELVTVSISLTKAGYAHREDVVGLVFQAIRLIKNEGVLVRIFAEQKQIKKTSFNYKETSEPASVVRSIVYALHTMPPENALDNYYLSGEFDDALTHSYLDRLTPQNLRLVVIGEDLETNMREPLYDVPYSISPIPAETMARWNEPAIDEALAIPAENPYIASDFTLFQSDSTATIPTKLNTSDGVEVWHLLDTSFGVPRANLSAQLFTPATSGSAKKAVMNSLYASLFNDSLIEFNYPLMLAGMSVGVSSASYGLRLNVRGYNEKQATLSEALSERLHAFRPSAARFALLKERSLRGLRNSSKERPISQAYWALGKLMNPTTYNAAERIEALEMVTVEDLTTFIESYYGGASLRVLAHGNQSAEVTTQIANALAAQFVDASNLASPSAIQIRLLPVNTPLVRQFEVDHNDATFIKMFQAADDSITTQAKYKLLGQVLKTPFFTELRTNQQLGYIVGANASTNDRTPSIAGVIQSANTDPVELQNRVETFISDYAQVFQDMSGEDFVTLKEGLIATLEEDETRLNKRTGRLNTDLNRGYTSFDHKAQLVSIIRTLTHDEMTAFYDTELTGETTRSLIVRSFGSNSEPVQTACTDIPCITEQMGTRARNR